MENKEKNPDEKENLVEIYEQVDEFVKFIESQIDNYQEKEN